MAIGGDSRTSIFPNTRAFEWQNYKRKETDEVGKKRGTSMEKWKVGTKERSPDGLSLPNQNRILINKIWYYFTTYGKSTMKFY